MSGYGWRRSQTSRYNRLYSYWPARAINSQCCFSCDIDGETSWCYIHPNARPAPFRLGEGRGPHMALATSPALLRQLRLDIYIYRPHVVTRMPSMGTQYYDRTWLQVGKLRPQLPISSTAGTYPILLESCLPCPYKHGMSALSIKHRTLN